MWEKELAARLAGEHDKFVVKLHKFEKYVRVCKDTEDGNLNKLARLLRCKKLFSVPWVIAHSTILKYYPSATAYSGSCK